MVARTPFQIFYVINRNRTLDWKDRRKWTRNEKQQWNTTSRSIHGAHFREIGAGFQASVASKIRRNIRATSLMKLPIYIPRPYDRLTCVVTARISTHDSHCRPFTCTIVWNIRVFNDLLELHHLLRGTTWFRRQILHSSTITRSCLYLVAKKLPRCRMSRPVNNDFWNSWSVTFAHIRWKQG